MKKIKVLLLSLVVLGFSSVTVSASGQYFNMTEGNEYRTHFTTTSHDSRAYATLKNLDPAHDSGTGHSRLTAWADKHGSYIEICRSSSYHLPYGQAAECGTDIHTSNYNYNEFYSYGEYTHLDGSADYLYSLIA